MSDSSGKYLILYPDGFTELVELYELDSHLEDMTDEGLEQTKVYCVNAQIIPQRSIRYERKEL